MNRLFVALNIPNEVKNTLFQICKENSAQYGSFKWEPKEKIHLTLKFIGAVKPDLVLLVCDSLRFVEKYDRINCSIVKFGFLYRFNEPQILWAELKTDESLFSLAEDLDEGLNKFGINKEKRKFKPHLTLLRLKKNPGQNFIEKFKNLVFDEIKFIAAEVSLYESQLHQSGSVYKEIKKFELR